MKKKRSNNILSCSLISIMLMLCGCSMVRALKGEPPKDVSSVKDGVSKQQAEVLLGAPQRDWSTASKIRYCIYSYDGGVPTSMSNFMAAAFFDLMTAVVIFELIEATVKPSLMDRAMEDERIYEKMAVSYDENNKVISVFDHFNDFDYLPPNGKKPNQ